MRYYIGQCEYKWSHAGTDLELLWVKRALGSKLFDNINQEGIEVTLLRSNSQSLSGDIYCRCDIFVDIKDAKQAILFEIKHSDVAIKAGLEPTTFSAGN